MSSVDDLPPPNASVGAKGGIDDLPPPPVQDTSNVKDASIAALEHFGNAASLGYLPQLQSLAARVIPDPNAGLDAKMRAEGFKIDTPKSTYLSDRDANIQRLNQEAKNYPLASAAGSVGGALASAGATSALAPIEAAGTGGRILQAAKGGSLIGAASNPGDVAGQATGLQLKDRLQNAVGGAVLGGAGQGAVEGLTGASKAIVNLPGNLQGKAEERAFKAAGAMLKDYRRVGSQDRINDLGRYMLDNGLVKPGMSVQDIADAADNLKNSHGQDIGDILTKLDGMGATAPSHDELATAIQQQALPMKGMKTAQPTYNTLQDVAEDIRTMGKPAAPAAGTLDQLTGKGEEYLLDNKGNPIAQLKDGNLVGEASSGSAEGATVPSNPNLKAGTFKDAQAVKEFINQQVESAGGWKALNPSEKNQALQQAYHLVNEQIENSAGQAAKLSGDDKLLQNYLNAKSGYRNAKDVSKIASDYALRQNANRFLSPSDYLTGGMGAIVGAMNGDSMGDKVKDAAIGASLGLVNHMGRSYGTPLVSQMLDRSGALLAKTPLPAIGEVANPILTAAEKTPAALAAPAGIMSQPSLEQGAMRSVASNQPQAQPKMPSQSKMDQWANQGVKNLGIQDQDLINRITQDPKGKQLLIQASDHAPGSKAAQQIMTLIQKGFGNKK